MEYSNWFMDFGLRMTQGYRLDHSKTLLKHFFDSLDSWTHSCPLSLATQTLKTNSSFPFWGLGFVLGLGLGLVNIISVLNASSKEVSGLRLWINRLRKPTFVI